MNEKDLKYYLLVGVLIVLILFGVKTIFDIRGGFFATTNSTITVQADGKESANFNIAELSLGIVSQAPNINDARAKNNKSFNLVSAYLKGEGIEDKDVKTQYYSIYPQYNYNVQPAKIIGYEVRNNLNVKIKDLSKLDKIMQDVVTKGVNEVSGINFTSEDIEDIKLRASAKAIALATTKAQALARELHVSLGKMISYSDYFSTPYGGGYGGGMGGGSAGGGPSVAPGQNEITVSANVVFETR